MSKATTAMKRIVAGQRAEQREALDEKRQSSFTAWLKDKPRGGFGANTPLIKSGYGIDNAFFGAGSEAAE